MAVHNATQYVQQTLDSLLGQTLANFELIAIDDCSTDGSRDLLERAATADPRVRVLCNDENMRQVRSLNRGILEARAPYVAIMDADDIAYPERLKQQAQYLDEHPDVGVVGCLFRVFEDDVADARTSSARVDGLWLDGNIVMAHATMMVRREVYDQCGLYDAQFDDAGDYEIQSRFAHHGVKLRVLPEPLLFYRVHGSSMTLTRRKQQVGANLRVSFRTIFRYRRMLTLRGWRVLARYIAVYLYLVLRLERIVRRSLGKRLWPSN